MKSRMIGCDDQERERIAQEADRLNLPETARAWRDSKLKKADFRMQPGTFSISERRPRPPNKE
jgi:hypothetical protein